MCSRLIHLTELLSVAGLQRRLKLQRQRPVVVGHGLLLSGLLLCNHHGLGLANEEAAGLRRQAVLVQAVIAGRVALAVTGAGVTRLG